MKRKLKIFSRKFKKFFRTFNKLQASKIKKNKKSETTELSTKEKRSGKKIKAPKKIPMPILLLGIFLVGTILVIGAIKSGKINVGRDTNEEVAEEDFSLNVNGKGFVGGINEENLDWMYDSKSMDMKVIWSDLVEHENSLYNTLDKKEFEEWETNMYKEFKWSEENIPDTILLEEAIELGIYCGFSEEEARSIILKAISTEIE